MKVYISDNPLEPKTYELFETDNLINLLKSKYDKFPTTGRIYYKNVSLENDVTPKTENDIDNLLKLDGPFFVLIYPGDPVTIVVAVVAIAATAAAAFLLKPKIPQSVSTDIQTDAGSSNNQLGSRQNKPNINGRVPDIYGQVRSIPDLIALPYTFFDSTGIEYELSYMCIGVGFYDITDIREGKTPFNSIIGGYSFYEPGNSPITGIPYLTGGQSIGYDFYNYNRLADLNGDTLSVPGTGTLSLGSNPTVINETLGLGYTRIISGLTVITTNNLIIAYPKGSNPNPADTFAINSSVSIVSPSNPDINGDYTIASIGSNKIKTFASSTGGANNAWVIELSPKKTNLNNGVWLIHPPIGSDYYVYNWVANQQITISSINTSLMGPFLIDDNDAEQALINFVAPSGIYGGTNIVIKITVTPYPSGTPVDTNVTLTPRTNFNGFKGYSATVALPGKCTITLERLTAKLSVDTDEIKVKDLFYGKLLTGSYDFVTTCLVLSKQTQTSTSSQERNFNCLAYRKIPTRISGNTFTTALTATNKASEILADICLSAHIGRRNINELDLDSIYGAINDVYNYFGPSGGINDVNMFNYTFDKSGISFEETIAIVSAAVHCTAYRQGNKIKLKFENENSTASLMFNHRNIIPDSMQRAVSFGIINDYDGIKFKYIDPADDTETIMYVPNSSVVNPKDIELVGIRSKVQAYYLAWRAWNKLKNQNIAIQFEALQESDLLVISDKILVADLTRNDVYDGEIIEQVGLTLTLNIDVNVSNGDTIFLQYSDGTIGTKTIVSQNASNKITINSAPTLSLVTDIDNYARTTFIIQKATSNVNLPFLVTDKIPFEKFTNELKVINYSDEYYNNDHDDPNSI